MFRTILLLSTISFCCISYAGRRKHRPKVPDKIAAQERAHAKTSKSNQYQISRGIYTYYCNEHLSSSKARRATNPGKVGAAGMTREEYDRLFQKN